MKLQDKHKQFTVKYDVRSLVHGVFIPVFRQKTLHTLQNGNSPTTGIILNFAINSI